MTINKSQGQTLLRVGLFFPTQVTLSFTSCTGCKFPTAGIDECIFKYEASY